MGLEWRSSIELPVTFIRVQSIGADFKFSVVNITERMAGNLLPEAAANFKIMIEVLDSFC